ncbi:MAG: hypothetical protein JWM97_2556, partial [Phycisphaerales bacterium]|nr:hypothetical protein [Phycisphaerales bacterium]
MTTPVSVPTRTKFSDWLGSVFAAVMWAIFLIGWGFDIQSFVWFLATLAVYLVMT